MVVGQLAETVQVLVIGGGPGGYACAIRAAQLGRQVALVERDAVGGVCLNVGCIPSKALIEIADLHHRASSAAIRGLTMTSLVDWAGVQSHLRTVVDGLTGGVRQLLRAAGVKVLTGTARFTGPNRVIIEGADQPIFVDFDQAVLATGSRPVELAAVPFDGGATVDSTGALLGPALAARVAIVGGGYIGLELGTALAKLGSTVTVVELTGGLLPGLDPALGAAVGRRLRTLGVDVRLGTGATGRDSLGLLVETGGAAGRIDADQVVVAVGRRPNTDGLGLDKAGVRLDDRGLVVVDETRRAAPTVCAIGDVTPGPALAHKATAEAEVAARTVAGQPARFDPAAIPLVVFTDPEVVSVGLTVADAGAAARSFRFPVAASGRARTLAGRPEGYAEIVADEAGTVVGVHLVGPHVSELAGEAALAIEMAATVEDLALTIHPHPTMSELLPEAAHGLLGQPLHIPGRS